MQDFLFVNGWFDRYRDRLGGRYPTFKLALNWLLQYGGTRVVETGSLRAPGNWLGDGCSTYLFGEFLATYGGRLWTCDADERVIATAKRETEPFSGAITYVHGDSVAFLAAFDGAIDLLYLDSLECPPEGDATGAQRHNLAELRAALPKLDDRAVVLLDDNDFPNGGKTLLSKGHLLELGWVCLLDLHQSLWTRRC